MTPELKGIHAKTFQDLDVIKDVLKLDEEKIVELEKENAENESEARELNIRLDRLIKENAELQHKVDTLQGFLDRDVEFDNLQKENAELKEKVNILDNCDRLGDMITEAYKDQLTKAKELLIGFISKMKNSVYTPYEKDLVERAEQFIKDL